MFRWLYAEWLVPQPRSSYYPRMLSSADTPYTKCHECGDWDGHLSGCVTGLRESYVHGAIELPEFEVRVADALACDSDGLIAPEGLS